MTKTRILVAMLLCIGSSFGQEGAPADSDGILRSPFGGIEALRAEIGLNDRQIERLKEIDLAREDALFPYARDAFEQEWALRRELRGAQLDEERLRMIGEDLERINIEIERVNSEHRVAAHAILSFHQLAGLRRLERAFESVQAAQEAIQVNLIEPPHGYPVGLLPFGPFGIGGFGLFGGLFGLLSDQPEAAVAGVERFGEGR